MSFKGSILCGQRQDLRRRLDLHEAPGGRAWPSGARAGRDGPGGGEASEAEEEGALGEVGEADQKGEERVGRPIGRPKGGDPKGGRPYGRHGFVLEEGRLGARLGGGLEGLRRGIERI